MESLDKEDVVNLSSDASSGDCVSLLEPVVKKMLKGRLVKSCRT